jgi:predicted DNA binding CopG/RHH family protein
LKAGKPKLALVRPGARKTAAAALARPLVAQRVERGEARLVVQLPADLHQAVKVKAARSGKSIRDYILELLRADGVAGE